MTIQAIETHYAGHRFRSRREARWAVFLNRLDVPWEYEPQGYVVNGTPYLPDFLIHPNTDAAFWLEIKATFPNDDELSKARGLAEGSGIPAFVYWAKLEAPAPDLSHLTLDELCGFSSGGYMWDDELGWFEYPTLPADWQIGLKPTAYRFNPSGKPAGQRSSFLWWTECNHCGHVRIANSGQVGWCPTLDGRPVDEAPEPYPNFGHRSERLLAAYAAARKARFEHGETPTT